MSNDKQPSLVSSILVFIVTIVLLAGLLEVFLVIKNGDGKNYDIEMWKYSRELKRISANPNLGHEHIPNKSAKLQNVDIHINSFGMRGAEPNPQADLKILCMGSSITFGWGVDEDKIYPELLKKDLNTFIAENPGAAVILSSRSERKDPGKNSASNDFSVDVMNAGIGNYNTVREVELFLTKYKDLKPNVIILGSFIRDPEIIPAPKRNWLLENSQLAVTLWSRFEQFKRASGLESSFEQHYKNIYKDDYEGWIKTQEAYKKLADYAKANNIRVIVAMIPDIHNLHNYPFIYIHEKVRLLAEANGFEFIDLYDSFSTIETQEEIWAMPGDPHPNALGHKLIGEQILNYLVQ